MRPAQPVGTTVAVAAAGIVAPIPVSHSAARNQQAGRGQA